MSFEDQPLTILIDGQSIPLGLDSAEPLVRAVIVSLFTWRRARPDDILPSDERMGWWGDTYPFVPSDQIGSRLWLLGRAKILPNTPVKAKEYCTEALAWLVDDGVCAAVEVDAERMGLNGLALRVRIYRTDGSQQLDLRFQNVWEFVNAV